MAKLEDSDIRQIAANLRQAGKLPVDVPGRALLTAEELARHIEERTPLGDEYLHQVAADAIRHMIESPLVECHHCYEKKPTTEVENLPFCAECLAASAECCACGGFLPLDGYFDYCDECLSEETVECEMCTCVRKDEPCRHVFYYRGEWHGCGSCEVEAERHKDSLFAVLKHTGLDGTLKEALVQHACNIQFHIPMIGEMSVAFHFNAKDHGRAFTNGLDDEYDLEERMSLGVRWLVSLQPGNTKEADDLTVKWIDEWVEQADKKAVEVTR